MKQMRDEIKQSCAEIMTGFVAHVGSVDKRFSDLAADEVMRCSATPGSLRWRRWRPRSTLPSPCGSHKLRSLSTPSASSCPSSIRSSTGMHGSQIPPSPESSPSSRHSCFPHSAPPLMAHQGTASTTGTGIVGLGVYTPIPMTRSKV
jgi:hypothetical protein